VDFVIIGGICNVLHGVTLVALRQLRAIKERRDLRRGVNGH
jgi:hypothetical protein